MVDPTGETPPTPQRDTTPQITRIDRALALLPLLVLAVVLVLLLAGCKDDRRPTGTTSTTSQTQQPSGQTIEDTISKAVADAISQPVAAQGTTSSAASSDPWGGPVPTAIHYPSQCPGATSEEINQALQSDGKWVCYASTREATK